MDRPIHPAYAEISDAYSEKSSFMTQVFQDIKENNFEKLHFVRKIGDESTSKLELPNVIRYQKQIPGPNDSTVNLTIFRPPGTEDQVLPIIIHAHGGGFALGSVQSHAKAIIDICLGANAVVVSVEYSLSPEAKYPVANEEVYSTLCWVKENADSIKGNPEKIGVAGDSAGGNIAAVVSLMAKDRGMGNVIKAQILLYPTLLAVSGYPSYELYGKGNYVLSSQDSLNFAEAYMPTEVSDLPHHYAKPLTATTEQLQGLPPALVLTCQCDVLRDEGEAYDTKLLEAGVDVVGIRMLGATHAFMSGFPVETSIYKQGLNNVIGFVKEKLNY